MFLIDSITRVSWTALKGKSMVSSKVMGIQSQGYAVHCAGLKSSPYFWALMSLYWSLWSVLLLGPDSCLWSLQKPTFFFQMRVSSPGPGEAHSFSPPQNPASSRPEFYRTNAPLSESLHFRKEIQVDNDLPGD